MCSNRGILPPLPGNYDRQTDQPNDQPSDRRTGSKGSYSRETGTKLESHEQKGKKMQRILKYYHDIFVSLLADTIHTDFDPKLSLGTLPFPLLLRNLEKKKPRNNMRLWNIKKKAKKTRWCGPSRRCDGPVYYVRLGGEDAVRKEIGYIQITEMLRIWKKKSWRAGERILTVVCCCCY